MHFKAKKMRPLLVYVASDSKSNLTAISETSISWHILQFFNNGVHINCAIIFNFE